MAGEWQEYTLESFCNKVADGTHDSPKEAANGKPLVTSKNIKAGRLDLTNTYTISLGDFEKINRRSKVDQWDLLLSMIGTVGEICIVKDPKPDFAIKNVGLLKTGSKSKSLWIYYYLKSENARQQIYERLRGSTQQYLSLGEIRTFPIKVPHDNQRDAITNVLSILDAKIELNQQTNETLESMAQALFKSWFVDFDPVKAKAEGRKPVGMDEATAALFSSSFIDSALGLIPEGWKIHELGTLVTQVNDRTRTNEYTASIPYVPIECISAKSIFLQNAERGENAQSSLTLFKEGDILFGAMRPYFHKVCIAPFDGVTRTTAFVLRANSEDEKLFSLYRIFDESTIAYATNNSEGSTIPYAKWTGSLEKMQIVLPPAKLRKAFGLAIDPLIAKGTFNLNENSILTETRDLLLPRLISGKLRVGNISE